MKISCEIECSPEEARRFLGMMDMTALNAAMTEELTRRVSEAVQAMKTEEIVAGLMKAGTEGLGEMQKQFFERFRSEWDRGA